METANRTRSRTLGSVAADMFRMAHMQGLTTSQQQTVRTALRLAYNAGNKAGFHSGARSNTTSL